MRQAVGNGITETNWTSFGFEPEFLIRYWQHSAVRTTRASEKILHEWMTAAHREMELTQACVQFQLAMMQPLSAAQAAPSSDRLMQSFREISERLWNGLGEAVRLFYTDEDIKFTDCALAPARGTAQARSAQNSAPVPEAAGKSVHLHH